MAFNKADRDHPTRGQPEETIHDEHPSEPAEGARNPGANVEPTQREHPSEPAEGRRDISQPPDAEAPHPRHSEPPQ